jgi:predicted enzyme related to lactoylglutathione lyase
MTALAFSFTKLVVADLERAVRFYGEVFGMAALHRVRSEEHAYPLEEVVMGLGEHGGGHRLVLVCYLDRPAPPPGALWTGFVVSDMAATLEVLARCGGRVEVPAHENAEHGVVAVLATDPEGHHIEIIRTLAPGSPSA